MCKRWCLVILLALAVSAQAGVIYYDDFNGAAADPLHGLRPAVYANSATWIANAAWKADGSVTGSRSSATLPFVPQAGKVYQLTVRFTEVLTGSWVATGFTAGSTTAAGGNEHRFISGITMGQPWVLHRSQAAIDSPATNDDQDQGFLSGTSATGMKNLGIWRGDVDIQIILDTRPALWSVTWNEKYTNTSTFTQVHAATYTANPNIKAVGMGTSDSVGKVAWILLEEIGEGSATTPEPAYGMIDVASGATLGWTAGSAAAITAHKLYIAENEPNFAGVTPMTITGAGDQSGIVPPITLKTDKTYFWRVDEIADPNVFQGSVWFFDTVKTVPTIDQDPVGALAGLGEAAAFEVHLTSLSSPTVVWYKEAGETDVKLVTNATAGTVTSGDYKATLALNGSADGYVASLTVGNVAMEDQAYYYCVVSNSGGLSDTSVPAGLTVKRLLAYYPFDTDASDAAGSNPGTLKSSGVDPNAVAGFGAGIIGAGALELDGTQYVELSTEAYPKAGLGNGLTSGTLSSWVRIDGLAAEQTNVMLLGTANMGTPSTACQFWVDPTPADFNFRIRHNAADAAYPVATPAASPFGDGLWHLLTVTYREGATAQIYLDGSALGNSANFAAGSAYSPWEYSVVIGANNNRGVINGHLVGAIDDMKIYNYPLSATEVADLYLEAYPDTKFCILPYATAYDFDTNCRVDLSDFAMLANNWLSCGVYPDCQ